MIRGQYDHSDKPKSSQSQFWTKDIIALYMNTETTQGPFGKRKMSQSIIEKEAQKKNYKIIQKYQSILEEQNREI